MRNAEQDWVDEILENIRSAGTADDDDDLILIAENQLRRIIENACADINFTLE